MSKFFSIALVLLTLGVSAQGRDEAAVLGQARKLNMAVFETKDSLVLEQLFAAEVTYGHSSGKVEHRREAISGIVHNRSTYGERQVSSYFVAVNGRTGVTRYTFAAKEYKSDGTETPLKIGIMAVWAKEKKEWKLIARQAVRLPE